MSFVGTGVGAINRSNRAAHKRRANLNSQLKPCRGNCITNFYSPIASMPNYSNAVQGSRTLTSVNSVPSHGTKTIISITDSSSSSLGYHIKVEYPQYSIPSTLI